MESVLEIVMGALALYLSFRFVEVFIRGGGMGEDHPKLK